MEEIMWLARDRDEELWLCSQKPSKLKGSWAGILGTRRGELPGTMFPEVKWSDDEPTKVKLEIVK